MIALFVYAYITSWLKNEGWICLIKNVSANQAWLQILLEIMANASHIEPEKSQYADDIPAPERQLK